ncbi:uroporphyrinogen-III C-methyltransferase, partial [Escherichia coli]|uniref:uroporphyrinogen-III C-methyltransferase n=1 Tax=Escherichia coli TaxID=562 RepID=UPI00127640DA
VSPMDSDGEDLSNSSSERWMNLPESWQNVTEKCITIRRRDATAVALLAPNQDTHLRESIRSRRRVGAQAGPRHRGETYRQSLE